MVNVRRRRRPARTSAASAQSPVPAPHAPAPAPRQGGPATVATRASATVAPTRLRRSTGSSVKRIPVERAALAPVFDDMLVGSSSPPFSSMNSATLCRTMMTRTNWRALKTTTPPDTQSCPSTIRSTTALREGCCRLSSKPTKTTMTMTHHPLLLALRPMRAMQQLRQPPLSTIWSMGATPPRHRPLLSACQLMRFAGGRRCHGRWLRWQRSGSRWRWRHGYP
jgi:hypothetical protein